MLFAQEQAPVTGALSMLGPYALYFAFAGTALGVVASMWTKIKGFGNRVIGMVIQRVEIPTQAAHDAVTAHLIGRFKRSRNYDRMYGATWEYQRDGRYGLVPYEQFGNRTLILWDGWVPFLFTNQQESKTPTKGENSGSSDKVKVYSSLTFVRGSVDVEGILKAACDIRNQMSWAAEDADQEAKTRFVIHHVPKRHDDDNDDHSGSNGLAWYQQGSYRLLAHTADQLGKRPTANGTALDNLIFPPRVKDLIKEIGLWRKSRDWYREKGIPWKRGWMLYGPPGTGKTTTVVELIRRAVANGETVLACAPSNAAVDNLLDKLLAAGLEPVRLGHPARVAPHLRDRALDLLVDKHPDARQARKFARDAQALFRKADKWTKAKPQPGEKSSLRAEAKALLAAARQAEQHAAERILDDARVVCGTLTGIDGNTLGQRRYSLCVIDEACQATEPACWVPLIRADRVVLAGDPCQLPPTILSVEAAERGLAVSLMERVMALYGPAVSRLLTVQYRMHAAIMAFSSAEFYAGELVAADSVVSHTLADLPGVTGDPLTASPVTFIDTAGAGYDEEPEEDTASRRNPKEAALAAGYVRRLIDSGVSPAVVGVITPYSGQVRRLRELLADVPGLEIDSVDAFQGREKEAIVLSLVRSNVEGEIGFLSDVRRTNVAMTRARRKLIVIGDTATLAGHPFYARLVEYMEAAGAYRSVWEE